MTAVEFVNFLAMLTVAFIVIRVGEIWGPSWLSTGLGVIFHA